MNNTNQEVAMVAAKWWANDGTNPKIDIGTGNPQAEMLSTIKMMIANEINQENNTSYAFIKLLAGLIEKDLDQIHQCRLRVDYDPDDMLILAAKQSGFDYDALPIKTCMAITPEEISVYCGDSAREIKIYPSVS